MENAEPSDPIASPAVGRSHVQPHPRTIVLVVPRSCRPDLCSTSPSSCFDFLARLYIVILFLFLMVLIGLPHPLVRPTKSIREVELIPSDVINDLRSIAERMITPDYMRECIQVYGSVRKSIVDESFWNLGIEKLSIGDIQRLSWDAVEVKIRRWIRAARVGIRVLFANDKKLCEEIFYGLGAGIDDTCFMETMKGPAIQLFNFAEAISISKRERRNCLRSSTYMLLCWSTA